MVVSAQGVRNRPALAIRIGVVFVGVTVWWLVLISGLSAVTGTGYTRELHVVRAVGATLGTIPLVYLARRFLDRKPWSGLGLSSVARGWRDFLFGAACWGIPAAISVALMLRFGWAEITMKTSLAQALPALLGLVVLVTLYEAVPEELVFRGYIYTNLVERWSNAVAIPVQAVLFTTWGALISTSLPPERVALFFVFGLVLGALRATTGNLWTCIGFHITFQVPTQFLAARWTHFELDDPDFNINGLAFVIIPFLTTAVVLWFVSRRKRRSADQR
ncbi:CPBP family intramembrane glutamic endopeptidase [Nocardia altamirensis]|uniref:CPBP family intramembrane glutamic endopeptidase n=1 Tax=Nocardia altamirensis TaxID=472158 RepID=UPI001FE0CE6C|nr:type II CAAX endopeptidase family protein [Nocardia altamirensis]